MEDQEEPTVYVTATTIMGGSGTIGILTKLI